MSKVKIINATERGQITLPKKWRDMFDTDCYSIEIKDKELIIRPMVYKKEFLESLKEASAEADREADRGELIPFEEIKKKYGL